MCLKHLHSTVYSHMQLELSHYCCWNNYSWCLYCHKIVIFLKNDFFLTICIFFIIIITETFLLEINFWLVKVSLLTSLTISPHLSGVFWLYNTCFFVPNVHARHAVCSRCRNEILSISYVTLYRCISRWNTSTDPRTHTHTHNSWQTQDLKPPSLTFINLPVIILLSSDMQKTSYWLCRSFF